MKVLILLNLLLLVSCGTSVKDNQSAGVDETAPKSTKVEEEEENLGINEKSSIRKTGATLLIEDYRDNSKADELIKALKTENVIFTFKRSFNLEILFSALSKRKKVKTQEVYQAFMEGALEGRHDIGVDFSRVLQWLLMHREATYSTDETNDFSYYNVVRKLVETRGLTDLELEQVNFLLNKYSDSKLAKDILELL
jgi:hypothetical protein